MEKPSYEELEFRFQSYCKHDGGTLCTREGEFCAICNWPKGKCQHRGERGNFCSQCGEILKVQGATND